LNGLADNPAHPDEMAVILRGMMAAELRRRTRPESGSIGGVPR
jgi:hypothetical protein